VEISCKKKHERHGGWGGGDAQGREKGRLGSACEIAEQSPCGLFRSLKSAFETVLNISVKTLLQSTQH
jgi:hypothetical protein